MLLVRLTSNNNKRNTTPTSKHNIKMNYESKNYESKNYESKNYESKNYVSKMNYEIKMNYESKKNYESKNYVSKKPNDKKSQKLTLKKENVNRKKWRLMIRWS